MILLFDIVETIAGLAIGVGFTSLISLIVYIFNKNQSDNKSRIDKRQDEINDIFDKHNLLEKEVTELKADMKNIKKLHDDLSDLVKDNHKETMKILYDVLSKLK